MASELPGLRRQVPPRALAISLLALAVAAAASTLWPDSLADYAALAWLLALVPPFLLAFHRGWRGAAHGLAFAMAVLLGLQLLDQLAGRTVDWRVSGAVAVGLMAVSLGAGAVSELLRRGQERALELAYADPLTGLPNRRVLDFFLERNFAAARRGEPLALVLFDLDGFKDYNDAEGHRAGDEAIRLLARALGGNTRQGDISGRYGGDEFLSILGGERAAGAAAFAERIRTAVAGTPLPLGPPVTISAGIATWEPSMESAAGLLDAADRALYRAKQEGGNRIARWDEDGNGQGARPREEGTAAGPGSRA